MKVNKVLFLQQILQKIPAKIYDANPDHNLLMLYNINTATPEY